MTEFLPVPPVLHSGQVLDTRLTDYFEDIADAADRYLGECQHYRCYKPRCVDAPLCAQHELQFWGCYGVPSIQSPLKDKRIIWVIDRP